MRRAGHDGPVGDLQKLSGGANLDSWLFSCGSDPVVLRVALSAVRDAQRLLGLKGEAQVIRAAVASGVRCRICRGSCRPVRLVRRRSPDHRARPCLAARQPARDGRADTDSRGLSHRQRHGRQRPDQRGARPGAVPRRRLPRRPRVRLHDCVAVRAWKPALPLTRRRAGARLTAYASVSGWSIAPSGGRWSGSSSRGAHRSRNWIFCACSKAMPRRPRTLRPRGGAERGGHRLPTARRAACPRGQGTGRGPPRVGGLISPPARP